MKKVFFQELMNTMMLQKLTTVFPFLRKERLSEDDLKDRIRALKKDGLVEAIRKSGQDPEEIIEMTLVAFDEAVKKIRINLKSALDQTVEYMKKEK